jgi:arginyl-tRNA synthetase
MTALFARQENADFWPLVYLAAQFPDVLERAAEMLEPAVVAKYAFQLAQTMNEFYHVHPVKDEPDPDRRALLISIIGAVRTTLVAALAALGIDAPRRM